ncbi:FAD binding domain-containing protein [Labedaea rhizosphaerae]|uniref:Carbon-monoxide dehydrogenase medium subunit n=1 Tax=Labedaea rhizosphaerae TaxID=598644 RepID=A0A4R6SIM3_LABRH|nr:xanthine dehydrogenase family protein subunit M [Labedaea rhizosphaerae]TDQ01523.1 carbon-monoxide dehydrogenase medium subunit [Labedaea rhizosphaerae]
MKPGRFTYHAPRSLDAALALLAEHGDEAKVLAGGQSLVPMLNFRLAQVDHLVDINRIGPEFAGPKVTGDTVTIPALVRQRVLERSAEVAAVLPVFAAALPQVAHPQIRNRGTVCGSCAHADPAAELPTVMSVVDSTFRIASARGTREVDAADFFQFHLTTALEPDELLTEVAIRVPQPGTRMAFKEFATRRGDFALVAVAASATVDESGTVTACRIAAAGVAPTPQRLHDAEAVVIGSTVDDEAIAAAEAAASAAVDPTGDIHATAEHRRRLTAVLVRRALAEIKGDQS